MTHIIVVIWIPISWFCRKTIASFLHLSKKVTKLACISLFSFLQSIFVSLSLSSFQFSTSSFTTLFQSRLLFNAQWREKPSAGFFGSDSSHAWRGLSPQPKRGFSVKGRKLLYYYSGLELSQLKRYIVTIADYQRQSLNRQQCYSDAVVTLVPFEKKLAQNSQSHWYSCWKMFFPLSWICNSENTWGLALIKA